MQKRPSCKLWILLSMGFVLPLLLGCQPKSQGTNGSTNEQGPSAQFTYQPSLPAIKEFIIFDGTASRDPAGGKLVSYSWEFGDGATGQGAITKHAYTAPGEYTVKLTVATDKGAKGTAQKTVRVFGEVTVKRTLDAPGADPRGLAWDGQALWVADGIEGTLYQLDPGTGKVLKSFEAPTEQGGADAIPMPEGLAWDGTNLWMISAGEAKILKLRPSDGKVLAALAAPSEDVTGLAWDGQALWVSDPRAGKIYQVDPKDGHVVKAMVIADSSPVGLAWDGQALWVSNEIEGKLYRLDPAQGKPTTAAKAPEGILAGMTWDGQALWLATAAEETELGKLYQVAVPR